MIQIGLASLLALLVLGASRVLGFWAFLVLLGGILAHFGDHLGTMVGKKRLSLFGFRPKHTAILVNFTTGALITMATLLGAMAISTEYREALLTVEQKKTEREQLTKNIAQLQTDSRELAAKLEGAQARLKELESELRKADETRQNLAREIERSTAEKVKAEQLALKIRTDKETGTVAIEKGRRLIQHPLQVPINVSRAQLKVALLAMMAEIRETVTQRGVMVPPSKPDKLDAELVDPIHEKITGFKEFYERSASAEFGGNTPKQMYIRPFARTNVAKGETLAGVFFDVRPNAVVLVKDEEIARTPVNGKLDAEQLLQQLINFEHSVAAELRRRGVSEDSLASRTNQVYSKTLMQFLGIIDLARKEGRWVEVRMFTSDDILEYGPIHTKYQVVEPPAGEEPDAPEAPEPAASPEAASPRASPSAP